MSASVLKTNKKLIRTNILHKCNRKRSNVSIHCVLKCHNHQRRKKIIIFTTYSTVRDSRRPAIYHLIPGQATVQQGNRRTPRHAEATLPAYAAAPPRLFTIIAQQFHIAKKNRIFIVAASHTLQKLFCISFPCVSIIGFYQKIIIKPFDYANSETHTSVSPVVKQQCLIMLFEKSGMLRPGLAMPFLLNSTVQLSRNSV